VRGAFWRRRVWCSILCLHRWGGINLVVIVVVVVVITVIIVSYGKKDNGTIDMKSLKGGTIHASIDSNRASDGRSAVGDCDGGEYTEIAAYL